jgi:hypothetical protein
MLAVNGPHVIDYARQLRQNGVLPSLDTPKSAHGNQNHPLANSLQVNLFNDSLSENPAQPNFLLDTDVAMPAADEWADVEMTPVAEPEYDSEEEVNALNVFSITDLKLYPEDAVDLPTNGIRPSELQQALHAYNLILTVLTFSVDRNKFPLLTRNAFLNRVCDLFLHVLSRQEGRALFSELLSRIRDQNIHIHASNTTNILCPEEGIQMNIDWRNLVSPIPLPLGTQCDLVKIALNDLLGFLENQI